MAGHRFVGVGFILVTPLPRALKALAGELEGEHTRVSPCSEASSHGNPVPSHSLCCLEGLAASAHPPAMPKVLPFHPRRCSHGNPGSRERPVRPETPSVGL